MFARPSSPNRRTAASTGPGSTCANMMVTQAGTPAIAILAHSATQPNTEKLIRCSRQVDYPDPAGSPLHLGFQAIGAAPAIGRHDAADTERAAEPVGRGLIQGKRGRPDVRPQLQTSLGDAFQHPHRDRSVRDGHFAAGEGRKDVRHAPNAEAPPLNGTQPFQGRIGRLPEGPPFPSTASPWLGRDASSHRNVGHRVTASASTMDRRSQL